MHKGCNGNVRLIRRLILVLIMFLALILCGCNKKSDRDISYSEYTKTDAGKPYSDWLKSPTGSAKYLDGDSLLVTIYLEDSSSSWTSDDIYRVEENLSIACKYLVEQGRKYGKDVNLIYDADNYPDLEYYMTYDSLSYSNLSEDDRRSKLVDAIYDYIRNDIDTKGLLEKYQVNSIGYMVFVDGEAESCNAYSYYTRYEGYYYEEFCIINLRWSGGNNVEPSTYAHELLHLFGAKDLYHTSEITGIYKDFVLYAEEEYENDIMLGSFSSGRQYSKKINSNITDLTAYFLGWTCYIVELENYPSIETEYPASFCDTKYPKQNYIYYSLNEKYDKTNKRYNMLLIIITVILVLRTIIIIYKTRKQEKEYNLQMARVKELDNNSNISLKDMNKLYMSQSIDEDINIIKDENE